MDMQKGSQSIDQYHRHTKPLAESLAAIDKSVFSKDLAIVVLTGLSPDYKMQ
ncbi:hypothetical protein GBA52_027132 [Prunus armeniaca]|nr:hypothetical protein GBA52_027132 [Prunus armeniaca]